MRKTQRNHCRDQSLSAHDKTHADFHFLTFALTFSAYKTSIL